MARPGAGVCWGWNGSLDGLRPWAPLLLGWLLPALVGAVALGCGRDAGRARVEVEEIVAGSSFAKAGLRPGDILVRWVRAADPPANPRGAAGEIRSPFDIYWLAYEQAPRGPIASASSPMWTKPIGPRPMHTERMPSTLLRSSGGAAV